MVLTAAHNLDGVIDTIKPRRSTHPSALEEFVGDFEQVQIDKKNVRIVSRQGNDVAAAVVAWAYWDRNSDIAVLGIVTQNDAPFFNSSVRLARPELEEGDVIGLIGYGKLNVVREDIDLIGKSEEHEIDQYLVVRCGYLRAFYDEGHILCRGPCIETTSPVLPGMSGGPVFKMGAPGTPIEAFAVISSGTDTEGVENTYVCGASIASIIRSRDFGNWNGASRFSVRLGG